MGRAVRQFEKEVSFRLGTREEYVTSNCMGRAVRQFDKEVSYSNKRFFKKKKRPKSRRGNCLVLPHASNGPDQVGQPILIKLTRQSRLSHALVPLLLILPPLIIVSTITVVNCYLVLLLLFSPLAHTNPPCLTIWRKL